MGKRKSATTEASIKKKIKQGRGSGIGADYQPWINVQDLSSRGLSTRLLGLKTNRMHSFLSRLETQLFYMFEWSEAVIDIREQFPLLPQAETLEIARARGVRHPVDPKTRYPVVMTTDFLLTIRENNGRTTEVARTAKYHTDLSNARVSEKLEIEQRYWANRGTDWGVVTEEDIPEALVRNVERLRSYYRALDLYDRLPHLQPLDIQHIGVALTRAIQNTRMSLADVTRACDRTLGHAPGTSLVVAYHLLATRQWHVDMNEPLLPIRRLVVTSISDSLHQLLEEASDAAV